MQFPRKGSLYIYIYRPRIKNNNKSRLRKSRTEQNKRSLWKRIGMFLFSNVQSSESFNLLSDFVGQRGSRAIASCPGSECTKPVNVSIRGMAHVLGTVHVSSP